MTTTISDCPMFQDENLDIFPSITHSLDLDRKGQIGLQKNLFEKVRVFGKVFGRGAMCGNQPSRNRLILIGQCKGIGVLHVFKQFAFPNQGFGIQFAAVKARRGRHLFFFFLFFFKLQERENKMVCPACVVVPLAAVGLTLTATDQYYVGLLLTIFSVAMYIHFKYLKKCSSCI